MTPVFSADDFGLTVSVNEAVERAHVEGVLGQASLMVAAPAAADAVRRARNLPDLKTGLHLVLVDGDSCLGHQHLPTITGPDGRFSIDQAALGVKYFFSPAARRELRAEIRAQFVAYTATGLKLHHADAHKHMHLHPTVARLMIEIGREYGLSHIRVPAEPPAIMALCGEKITAGDRALYAWSRVLRRQAIQAGLATTGSRVRPQMVRPYDRGKDQAPAPAPAGKGGGNLFPPGDRPGRCPDAPDARLRA